MKLDQDNLMDFAVRTVTDAGQITLERFGRVAVEYKGDGSEVTEADRAAETFIRSAIAERFPDHGVYGEEGVNLPSAGSHRWVIDPIDGTRSFASGVPLYAVLLALEVDGIPLLGCAHFPALSDTIVAAVGGGCWWGDRRAGVSECTQPREARIVTSGLEYWRDWATPEGRAGFERLLGMGRFGRTWGDAYGYILVATGRAEILADPACGARWDYAPVLPILTEAGGRFTTLSGLPVHSWSSALASNSHLHEAATSHWAFAEDDTRLQMPVILGRHER
jgi:histidinol-phosphatase